VPPKVALAARTAVEQVAVLEVVVEVVGAVVAVVDVVGAVVVEVALFEPHPASTTASAAAATAMVRGRNVREVTSEG
jgi:hypothetical protein